MFPCVIPSRMLMQDLLDILHNHYSFLDFS